MKNETTKFGLCILLFCLLAQINVVAQTKKNTLTEEGAWCWFADPRAISHENESGTINNTYIGYIDIYGNIKATQINHLTQTTSEVLIRSYFQPDDHNNPTFLVLPDERVMIFYSRHTDEACFYYRISQKSGDITTLGKEIRLETANNTTYPSPFILSDDPEHIYLCWRGIGWHPTIARLTMPDENDNVKFDWGPFQILRSLKGGSGVRPYAKYASNGKDKIHLTYTTTHPDNKSVNYIYYNYIDINTKELKDIKANTLSEIGKGDLHDVDATDDYKNNHPYAVVDDAPYRDWVWEIATDEKENPVIAMVRISENKESHDYYYARWTGKEWQKTFLSNAGGHFHQTPELEKCYSGGMAIDKTNPNVIYASVPVYGKFGSVYELKKFTIAPDGTLASTEQLTSDSPKNNVRPFVISGKSKDLKLVWMYGDYYDWIVSARRPLGYSTAIRTNMDLPVGNINLKKGLLSEHHIGSVSPEKTETIRVPKSKTFSIVMNLSIDHDAYYGDILRTNAFTYSLKQDERPNPYIQIKNQLYESVNVLGNSDAWKTNNRGTGGQWYTPTKLNTFQLAISYENGVLKTYINGLADQYIELNDLSLSELTVGGCKSNIHNISIYNRALSQSEIRKLIDESSYKLTLDIKNPGAKIQPTMYGLFFEDINFGADGGLYAELIKNRSFEFPQTLMGWNTFGNVEIRTDNAPFNRNPHYVRLTYAGHKEKHTGLENEGFKGIGVKKDDSYRFSVWARCPENTSQKIRIELVDSNNNPFVKKELEINSKNWEKYELIIQSPLTKSHARLRIFFSGQEFVDLEHISLFPVDTWKGRKNGLRKDLATALFDLNPGVFRFPGGCIVEGTDLETRYDWKKSIGIVENRPLNENRWHYTFTNRFFPDYFQTYGMGFYELFLLSEDLGAEPLPIVNVGLACQYQNNSPEAHVHVDNLGEYIQDALDLIEFANGSATSSWGKIRAEMGHPEPFNLKFIGIGNEQWGPEYPERLEKFIHAIRKQYPEIKIIGSSGPQAEGKDFEYLWPEMKRLKVDLVDEHYYRSPEWFLKQAARYDNYDRKGPKVFAGEYACHPQNRKNNFESALCESAFMTGLERNADIVHMATYAPLFAHVDAWQWRPDLIWFDNLNSVRTPNYHVQKLYADNAGTNVLPLTLNKQALTGQDGLYASAVIDTDKKEVIVKLTNSNTASKKIQIQLEIPKKFILNPDVEVISLHGDADSENTLTNPNSIQPQSTTTLLDGNTLQFTAEPQTFYVLKMTNQVQKEDVIKIIHKTNQYWQSTHPKPANAFWHPAAYHTGNMAAYEATKEPAYLNYSVAWAEKNEWKGAKSDDKAAWKYNYGERDEYVLFGDWQICFQTYIDLYAIKPDKKKIARAIEVMEYQMSTPNNDYWWWVDGLYMVMPVMTKLHKTTGNPLYLEKLYEYFTYAKNLMHDKESNLFFRDAKYIYPKHQTKTGKKDFWARGNGWLFAGLAKTLQDLPLTDPHRDEYIQLYQSMAKTLKASQQPEGHWTRSIFDPEHAPGYETSGTAFFTYGFLWGINNGLLEKDTYKDVIDKSWKYLTKIALQPNGKVGYVQPIGERADQHKNVGPETTADFGVGAFLLAASEMLKYINDLK